MAKIVLKSEAELNVQRKKLRTILLLCSIPFLILILFFGYKATMLYVTAGEVISLTEEGKYSESVEAAQKQKENSFVDPWLADYNLGVAYYNNDDPESAITALKRAATQTSSLPDVCYISNALSKSYEKYGDQLTAENRTDEAENAYYQGKQVIENADPSCFPPSTGEGEGDSGEGEGGSEDENQGGEGSTDEVQTSPEQQQGEQMQETEKRLDEKLGNEQEEQPQPNNDSEGKRDEIQEEMNQGNEDKQDDDNAGNTPNSNENPVDRPW